MKTVSGQKLPLIKNTVKKIGNSGINDIIQIESAPGHRWNSVNPILKVMECFFCNSR